MRANPVAEAEWHLASVEARIMLAMRQRAAGERIADAVMIRMFDQLETANERVHVLRVAHARAGDSKEPAVSEHLKDPVRRPTTE